MRESKESGPPPTIGADRQSTNGGLQQDSLASHTREHRSWKQYKLRFLAAEETQRSQWGVVDAFKRYDTLEAYLGWLQPCHAGYREFSYVALRGWKE